MFSSKKKYWILLTLFVSLILIVVGCTASDISMPTSSSDSILEPIPNSTTSLTPTGSFEKSEITAPTAEPPANPAEAEESGEPLKIGVLADLSGSLSQYGTDTWQGLQLGLDYATGGSRQVANRPLELVMIDTASDITTGMDAANQLLGGEGVQLLVGPNLSAAALGNINIIDSYGIVYFATSAAPEITSDSWNQNTFRLCPIFPPDGPIISSYSGGALSTQFLNNDSVAELSPEIVGQVGLSWYHYTLPESDVNSWLVEEHQGRFNEFPDLYAECGFATAQAIVAALEATGGDPDPGRLIPALEGLQFDGPKGDYTIRPADHQVLAPVYVVRLANTADPDQAYFELVEVISPAEESLPCRAPGCE